MPKIDLKALCADIEKRINAEIDKVRAELAPGQSKTITLRSMPDSTPFEFVVTKDVPPLRFRPAEE